MELKVWVEGIQRIICGVTDQTTCQDVVFALAHATGKTGRFTLIERWRNNERLLAPNESPLKILTKLGEYSSEVQFILQKSEKPSQSVNNKQETKLGDQDSATDKFAELRQAAHLLEKQTENVGIVKGIPQKISELTSVTKTVLSINPDINPGKVEIVTDRKLNHGQIQTENPNLSNENLLDLYSQRLNNSSNYSNSSSSPVASSIGVSGSLKPPAYRNPPAPKNTNQNQKLIDLSNGNFSSIFSPNDNPMQNVQYRDLVQLIKYQREKINNQQSDLTKFDAEIVYLESKGREQIQHLEAISQELSKTDQIFRQGSEQMQTLQYVDEENDLVHQQEKTLKSEITLLRSKLGILETELLQCRNKIKKLMDEIQIEQRNQNQHHENRQQLEHRLMSEVDRLQADIDYAIHSSDNTVKTADGLKKEVMLIEMSIGEKKKQLEKLVQEMKEVNLQSLTVSTDEVPMGEGSAKTGRRIIGSPRQLENAVATSKNPHGVWV